MNNNHLISVIVPIYKVEPYLKQCIDSIVKQTYTNLEIILVDDGSPDNCPAICNEYAKKDSRIIVIHKENGGLSDARNAGLNICTGDYVFFVDSDDWIESNTIQHLAELSFESNADITIADYTTVHSSNDVSSKCTFIHAREVSLQFLMEAHQPGNPFFTQVVAAWNKLIRKNLAQKHPFPKGVLCEDHYTTYKYYSSASKVILSNFPTYLYRIREGSIVNNLGKDPIKDNYIQHEYLRQRIIFFLQQEKSNYASLFVEQYTRNALYLYSYERKKHSISIKFEDISAFIPLINRKTWIKYAVKNLNMYYHIYHFFSFIFREQVTSNLILGRKNSLIGIVWNLLHLPNTQIRKKLKNRLH